jgi:hypothetical protein
MAVGLAARRTFDRYACMKSTLSLTPARLRVTGNSLRRLGAGWTQIRAKIRQCRKQVSNTSANPSAPVSDLGQQNATAFAAATTCDRRLSQLMFLPPTLLFRKMPERVPAPASSLASCGSVVPLARGLTYLVANSSR